VSLFAASSAVHALASPTGGDADPAAGHRFQPLDVFALENARDARISPDGEQIVYVRVSRDILTDHKRSNLWIIDFDGADHRPLLSGTAGYSSPRWSPDGGRLAYLSGVDGKSQIYVRWMDTGQTARITDVTEGPGNIAWSRDGTQLAFTMWVPRAAEPLAKLPPKPAGAEWAEPMRVYDQVAYRHDGGGYVEPGNTHVFVVPAEGGAPRQLTHGDHDHGGPLSWMPDGRSIVLRANRHDDRDLDPRNNELFALSVADGSMDPLTDRVGPDDHPDVSPDGESIAYTGFDDRVQGFQETELYVMPARGGEPRLLTGGLERSVREPCWAPDGKGVYFMYADQGVMILAYAPLKGDVQVVASGIGGTYLGRPYTTGAFTVGPKGRFATTVTGIHRPPDVAAGGKRGGLRKLTSLNEDLLAHKQLGAVEELRCRSSHDQREIQSWLVKPPDFDPTHKYPLILEIHGGPFAAYGPQWATEMQLYAAAGYVVLYVNPRGSTSYGEEFANLIHHDYPGPDYDDLMSAVDAAIGLGYVDPERLFVTGGSGGGVLSAWIVGKTERFRAAAVVKPIVNWQSFALTTDFAAHAVKYWLKGTPWEEPVHYWERSPLSLVGQVTTPTMLMTGEEDYRTPICESEQFYQALKLREVETVLVRVPNSSHGITGRPSNLIAKVAHIIAWFERERP